MPFMLPVFSRKTVSGGHFNNDETYQSPGAKHLVIMGCRIKLLFFLSTILMLHDLLYKLFKTRGEQDGQTYGVSNTMYIIKAIC